MPNRPTDFVSCPRCNVPLDFVGTKLFHEGTRAWDFLGGVFELFKNREHFDVYVCQRCGRVELFVEGIGEELRGEAAAAVAPGIEQEEAVDLLNQASSLDGQGEWDEAIAIYETVLNEPRYRAHHQYARNSLKLIREKKSLAEGGA
jgi:hypothetical protein